MPHIHRLACRCQNDPSTDGRWRVSSRKNHLGQLFIRYACRKCGEHKNAYIERVDRV